MGTKRPRRKIATRKQILEYWEKWLLKNSKFIHGCFACGSFEKLHRAHILAYCEGGNDNADNLHLLCHQCHRASEYFYGEKYFSWFLERTAMDSHLQKIANQGVNIWSLLKKSGL